MENPENPMQRARRWEHIKNRPNPKLLWRWKGSRDAVSCSRLPSEVADTKKNTCSESLKLRDTPKYLQNISKISPKSSKIRNCSMFPRESLPSTPVTNSTCRHGSRSILTPGRWAHMVGLVKFSFGCVGFQILYVPCCLSNQIQVGGSYNLGIVSSFQASVIENALLQFGISQTNFATLETWYRGPTMCLTMSLLTFKWNRV